MASEHRGTRELFQHERMAHINEIYRITDETAALNAHPQFIEPSFARDDSVMRKLLPELRANRDTRRGNRQNPERPTLVAKVCEGRGKGELWLGPLPILTRMKVIRETVHSVQIYCFSMEPESVIIDEREAGRRIPGAFVFRCDVSNPVTRTSDFEALQEFVITSLRQEDNVYVHCVTGVRRAVIVAALLSAILMDIKLEAAMDIINQSRHVEFSIHTGQQWNARYESMEGHWMDEMHQKYRGTGNQRHDSGQSSGSCRSTPDQVCDATFEVARAVAAAEEAATHVSYASHDAPINYNANESRET
jgi:rhodanese-related sulfurtransferase